jgi:DNA-binding MarR family transcriptional regulator
MERLLERIRDDPEATTAQIAAAAQVTQQAVSKLVGALHDAGYLRDVPYPEDRRRRVLALTTRGHDALAAAAKARQQLWKASRTDVQADVLAAVSS